MFIGSFGVPPAPVAIAASEAEALSCAVIADVVAAVDVSAVIADVVAAVDVSAAAAVAAVVIVALCGRDKVD